MLRGYCGTMMDALNFIVNKDLLMDYATIAKVEELKTTPICKGTITSMIFQLLSFLLKTTPTYKGTRVFLYKKNLQILKNQESLNIIFGFFSIRKYWIFHKN